MNCLRGIFANFDGIMKINAELQRKESRKQIPKTVLRWYQKNNRLFLRNNRLFLAAAYKKNLKTKFKELRVRYKHASNLYWFTLTPRATSSPQKPRYAIKTRLHTPHTKVVTLNPSRNTLPLANHTKSVDLEPLKNTQHSLATQIQKYSNQGRRD